MGICPKANCTSHRRRMGLEHRGRKQRWPANLRAKTSFYGPLARFHQNIRVPIVPLAPTIWPSSPVFSQTLTRKFRMNLWRNFLQCVEVLRGNEDSLAFTERAYHSCGIIILNSPRCPCGNYGLGPSGTPYYFTLAQGQRGLFRIMMPQE